MSEDLVIRHCAPTLAGIKTGNLFSCACPCKAALTKELCRLNRKLVPKGIRALPLRVQKGRALIVVLDEATAYIDPENEALVQRAVGKLVAGRTVLVIAHRLSTITGADQIVVVNGGRIEATGKHEKLLETCPLYREMWQAHMGVKEGEQA